MKSAFRSTDSSREKIKILKLLPKEWSFSDIKQEFDDENTSCNNYLIEEAKKNTVFGIERLVGRPSMGIEVKNKIINFFVNDDVARPFPGLKDCISIKLPDGKREKRQKRLLLDPLEILHKKYLETCAIDDEKVSLSFFKSLRPKECVFAGDASAANTCVCVIHENMNFLVQALHKTESFNDEANTPRDLLRVLRSKVLCKEPSEACFLRNCDNCETDSMVTYVLKKMDESNISTVKFSLWVTSPQCEIITSEEEVDNFIDRFNHQLGKFIIHHFKVEKQKQFIELKKITLKPGEEILCQMDFAEKYTCFIQNAPQSCYWDQKQVTIHPFVIFKRNSDNSKTEISNIIVISNVKKQNTTTVHAFQEKLMPILTEKIPNLKKIIYLSDGCAEQYKNNFFFKSYPS